jgi:hypothetical protein
MSQLSSNDEGQACAGSIAGTTTEMKDARDIAGAGCGN